jgi:hypothetical protein
MVAPRTASLLGRFGRCARAFRSRALELQDVALAASRRGEQADLWLGPVDVTEQDAAE